eukprot:3297063-Amphidinium_carterae.1
MSMTVGTEHVAKQLGRHMEKATFWQVVVTSQEREQNQLCVLGAAASLFCWLWPIPAHQSDSQFGCYFRIW